jgi:hypothetical protein
MLTVEPSCASPRRPAPAKPYRPPAATRAVSTLLYDAIRALVQLHTELHVSGGELSMHARSLNNKV